MLLTQVIDTLLSPLGVGLLLALALWRLRLPRVVRGIAFALGLVCLVLTTPLGASVLLGLAEGRAPADGACTGPAPTTIVVLGGGVRRAPASDADVGALSMASTERMLDAAEFARARPEADIVISGGGRPGDAATESQLMASLAARLGIGAERVRTETTSRTTWENAVDTRSLTPPVPRRLWLVTSALHMPRALIAFRAAGFDPCARAVDYRAESFRTLADLLPHGGSLAISDGVLHEWAGELAYRWKAARQTP